MGQRLSPVELEIYRRVDEVLHYLWDPIGVAGTPECRNEYQSYLPQVYSMLMAKKPASEIAGHIANVASESMGLRSEIGHLIELVEIMEGHRDLLQSREEYHRS